MCPIRWRWSSQKRSIGRAFRKTTPLPIRRLLRRCLQKDPKKRLADIGDARLEIEEALAGPSDETIRTAVMPHQGSPVRRRILFWAPSVIAVVLAAGWIVSDGEHQCPRRVRRSASQ